MGSGQSTLVSTQESGGQEEDRVLEFSAATWWEGAFAQLRGHICQWSQEMVFMWLM